MGHSENTRCWQGRTRGGIEYIGGDSESLGMQFTVGMDDLC
jgi:hypothetical protein